MDKHSKNLMDRINKELGTEAITHSDHPDADEFELDVHFVKDSDHIIHYGILCDNEDDLYNTLQEILNGVELAKAVFNK